MIVLDRFSTRIQPLFRNKPVTIFRSSSLLFISAIARLAILIATFATRALAADLEVVLDRDAAAMRHLETAFSLWKRYATVRDAQYVPALYNRVGYVDVTALTDKAAIDIDIDIARKWKPGALEDDGKRSGSEKGFRQ